MTAQKDVAAFRTWAMTPPMGWNSWDCYYTDEIHMIRKAIDQTGRPMVLSLSPGKTQYQYAKECLENANMFAACE